MVPSQLIPSGKWLCCRWGPDRPTGTDDANTVKKVLTARLDRFKTENITVVAAAGPGLDRFCESYVSAA